MQRHGKELPKAGWKSLPCSHTSPGPSDPQKNISKADLALFILLFWTRQTVRILQKYQSSCPIGSVKQSIPGTVFYGSYLVPPNHETLLREVEEQSSSSFPAEVSHASCEADNDADNSHRPPGHLPPASFPSRATSWASISTLGLPPMGGGKWCKGER